MLSQITDCGHEVSYKECDICAAGFTSRERFDAIMDSTLSNSISKEQFVCMTYLYHADALTYPPPEYRLIRTPFLVVTGTKDTIIQSSDAFVQKAKDAGANITYHRIEDMDHYVRKRPDITQRSFEWLASECLKHQGQ
jgi:acetyl esterase/lipase